MKTISTKNNFSEWSDEKLLKRSNLLKGLLIGAGSTMIVASLLIAFLLITKPLEKMMFISFIPLLILPVTLLPVILLLNNLKKEIHYRNL